MDTLFHIKTHDSITVIVAGKPHTVTSDHARYDAIVGAIRDGDATRVSELVDMKAEVTKILGTFGDVQVYGGHVTYAGETINNYLVDRIVEFAASGDSIEPLANFLNNVQKNPSRRAAQDLYSWCEAGRMPITPDGCIVAYKIVGADYLDLYSHKFDNSVGKRVEMPRNGVNEDPNQTCSQGLHFCSAAYLPHYGSIGGGSKVMLVKVNPADVVAFPTDYNLSKARCCGYDVIEEIDAATAASFFEGRGFVYSASASVPIADWDEIVDNRIEAIEEYLGIVGDGDDYPGERLDTIEAQLGLTDDGADFDDRLSHIETILHL